MQTRVAVWGESLPRKFCALARNANHCGIQDLRVREEDGLELGRGYLSTLVLDEFLEIVSALLTSRRAIGVAYLLSINNVEPTVSEHTDIARIEPSVLESLRVRLGVVPVPLDDQRSTDQNFTLLTGLNVVAVLVNQLGVVTRHQAADGSRAEVRPVDGDRRDAASRLAEAPGLSELGGASAQLLAHFDLQVLAHWCRSRNGVDPGVELVCHQWRL